MLTTLASATEHIDRATGVRGSITTGSLHPYIAAAEFQAAGRMIGSATGISDVNTSRYAGRTAAMGRFSPPGPGPGAGSAAPGRVWQPDGMSDAPEIRDLP